MPPPQQQEQHVPLRMENPQPGPVSASLAVGVPLARGVHRAGGRVWLSGPEGRRERAQARCLATWPDGSARWLLVEAQPERVPVGKSGWTLHLESPPAVDPAVDPAEARGPSSRPGPSSLPDTRPLETPALHIQSTEELYRIDTGSTCFEIHRQVLHPFVQVWHGVEPLLVPHTSHVQLRNPAGQADWGQITDSRIEGEGALRVTVRLEGRFPGISCRFVMRLTFFAGRPDVRLRLTLHNPQRARHSGGLWDLGDGGSILFRDLSLELQAAGAGIPGLRWRLSGEDPVSAARTASLELYQDSSGGSHWRHRNHVNRDGRVPVQFQGYRLRYNAREEYGTRASPTLELRTDRARLGIAVPAFWENFPGALETHGTRLVLRFFPHRFDDLFELQGGEQKTREAWLSFGRREHLDEAMPPDADSVGKNAFLPLEWIHRPPFLCVEPEWIQKSGVISYFQVPVSAQFAADAGLPPFEALMLAMLEGPSNYFDKRERIDEYGWRHFGEVYADHENLHFKGEGPVISHFNNQYDFLWGLLLQAMRSGDSRWMKLAGELGRHLMDIDIYRTKEDKSAYNGGLFWHTDHYLNANTCTHRTFSRANAAGRNGYGGGPGCQHNTTTGLLHLYYLTGDPDAAEAVRILADWVMAMDDGGRNILALLSDAPTGWASATFDFHGPGRGAGYSVNALLDAWLLTGARPYLEKAEALIQRAVHPSDDVSAHDLLNAELRWSYTIFLMFLARYLELKATLDTPDPAYAYAQASLVRYASWMLEHEQPYFDREESLEFPTETWAGQEIRKANVLRLASQHVDEPLRSRLLERARELADRAWKDLLRFESRGVTRSMAIWMQEGSRDHWFRLHQAPPALRPERSVGFDPPQRFVSQRGEVKQLLRQPTRAMQRLAKSLVGGVGRRLLSQQGSVKP